MQNSTRLGIGAGVATMLYFTLFFFIQPALIIQPVVYWAAMAIYLLGMWLAFRQTANAGFEQQLRACFTVFLIANFIFWVFNYLLINYIAPDTLQPLLKEQALAAIEWARQQANERAPNQQFEKALQEAQQRPYNMTIGQWLMSLAMGSIGGFLLSFVMVQLLRKIYYK